MILVTAQVLEWVGTNGNTFYISILVYRLTHSYKIHEQYCACPPHGGKRTDQASRHRKFTSELYQFPRLIECVLSQENAYLQTAEVMEYCKRTSESEVGTENTVNICIAVLAKLSKMKVVCGHD
jgi:hypothetical protein